MNNLLKSTKRWLISSIKGHTSSLFSTEDGCDQSSLGAESGVLSSKNYPGVYPNNSWCEWKIRVSSSHRIVIKFEDLSFEGEDCEMDYLKILKDIQGTKYGKQSLIFI